MPRYNLESELLMEDHTKRLATDDVGEGEELSDYILGWVDGLARRPLPDAPVLDLLRYTGRDVIAFELGRDVVQRLHGAAAEAEVRELAARIQRRLNDGEETDDFVQPGTRSKTHLRLLRGDEHHL
jgi:hypothetical protein